jgi:hypothetical protein
MATKRQSTYDKGNFLETVYYLFEKSLDYQNAKLTKNYKLKLEGRPDRELDILVEHESGLKKHRLAIECKNYKEGNNVDISEITDFGSKIEDTDISGFFVTTSFYKEGAIKEAKRKGVKLYKLKKSLEGVEEAMEGVLTFKEFNVIENVRLLLNDTWLPFDDAILKLESCSGCVPALFEFLKNSIFPSYQNYLSDHLDKNHPEMKDIKSIRNYVGEENAKEMALIFKTGSSKVTHNNVIYEIKCFRLEFKVWYEMSVINNLHKFHYELIEIDSDELLGKISPISFQIEDKNIFATLNDFDDLANNKVFEAKSISIEETGLKDRIDNLRNKND